MRFYVKQTNKSLPQLLLELLVVCLTRVFQAWMLTIAYDLFQQGKLYWAALLVVWLFIRIDHDPEENKNGGSQKR